MAQLLRQAIDSGAPPSLARIPMTPEDVAASYEEAYGADEDRADEGNRDAKAKKARTPARARPGMGKRDVATGLPTVTKPRGRRLNCQAQMWQQRAATPPLHAGRLLVVGMEQERWDKAAEG
jgi:hypothetical protein